MTAFNRNRVAVGDDTQARIETVSAQNRQGAAQVRPNILTRKKTGGADCQCQSDEGCYREVVTYLEGDKKSAADLPR